jgi:hypothetical protein
MGFAKDQGCFGSVMTKPQITVEQQWNKVRVVLPFRFKCKAR